MPADFELEDRAVLPCGCREVDAFYEQWAVGASLWTKRIQNGCIAAMGRDTREQIMLTVYFMLGVDEAGLPAAVS